MTLTTKTAIVFSVMLFSSMAWANNAIKINVAKAAINDARREKSCRLLQ